ncbi:PEP-CTERM sorting domain-containing protein [Aquabacterium humicola]|uniref:PEP-CTERM sorting domain-containing protein n=1 Tax=Aquabacterium humicola TaxID=3237377 RepID=UPI00254368C5|nr:PEP-CTERM sorting domain-containing protein [Rubrivivax pictus]
MSFSPLRRWRKTLAVLLASLPVGSAFATSTQPLPEPESWALIGIAALAAAIVTIRNRRK